MKCLQHGRQGANFFIYIISLNPYSDPMRLVLSSHFPLKELNLRLINLFKVNRSPGLYDLRIHSFNY